MAFAQKTEIPFEKSIAEIIGLLRKAGADSIAQLEGPHSYSIGFELSDRKVRFTVVFPDAAAIKRLTGPRQDPARVAEQWRRQRGRALLLVLRAKLESIASGVETAEQAFLANIVTSTGETVHQRISPAIASEYASDKPQLMLGRSS